MIHYQSVNPTRNAFTSDTPITEFPRNQVTVFYYDSVGQGNFPVSAGVVTTYRMNQDNWSYQELISYNTGTTYNRRWRDGSWTEWIKTSAN
mgnify:FL=1